MIDHEVALTEKLRGELIEEHKRLEEELFRQMPLKERIHAYIFAIVYVGTILFGLWLLGYTVYVLITRRA